MSLTMMSAIVGDEVSISVGGQTFELRPTLRAAIGAHRLCGGFANLLVKVDELDSATMARLLEIGSGASMSRTLYIAGVSGLNDLREPLADYALTLANGGTRPVLRQDEPASPQTRTHEDYFAHLLKLGTGWIGWTVDQTLDAPMPAIVSAYVGRQEMLQAIFGSSSKLTSNTIPLDEKVRMVIGHFGTVKVKRS